MSCVGGFQEAETFGFSRVVVPFTPRRRSSAGAAAGHRKYKESGTKRVEASESVASAGSGRGRIEVVECRFGDFPARLSMACCAHSLGRGAARAFMVSRYK